MSITDPAVLVVEPRPHESEQQHTDRGRLVALIDKMAKATTAEGLTQCWHDDVVWFDTITLVRRSKQALLDYQQQHTTITNLRTKILMVDAHADGDVGFAYSIQHFWADGVNGGKDIDFVFRATDCFIREDGDWQVRHQHVSLPFDLASYRVILDSEYEEERRSSG